VSRPAGGAPRRLLVIGAGEAGQSLVRELLAGGWPVAPVGFLDDDPALQGESPCGLPVLGATADLPAAAARVGAQEILIAIPSATGAVIRRLVLLCRRAGLSVRIVPGIRAIIEGDVRFDQVRPVAPDDLLGRESVTFRADGARELVAGRRVLVTGAGGSIGGELCRQLLPFAPAELLLLGRGENSLFEIAAELEPRRGEVALRTLICDVRDGERLAVLAGRHGVDLILHAAAHKHVPLMEENPEEAVAVNVLGTANMIRFARHVGAARLVLVSTDKAAIPASIMGATKRVAEELVRAAGAAGGPTRFLTVRFGNVLGSRGSVVPLFQDRIRRGLPLPVTDRAMTRYFMTIREAAQLVIEAMALGESGATYILEMGEPVSILELARNLLALSGFDPDGGDGGPGIVITGARPGERLTEELIAHDETLAPGANPLIRRAVTLRPVLADPEAVVAALLRPARAGDRAGVRQALARLPGLAEVATFLPAPEVTRP
jgi:FlaA1/EpsC-like NDP-sugar epimerase